MREFVTEQYIPASGGAQALARADAARRAAEQLAGEGAPVEFVRSIFIPEDETCILVFRADSIELVRAAAARASLRLDHIVEAVTRESTGGAQ
jgi:hypothetical protein